MGGWFYHPCWYLWHNRTRVKFFRLMKAVPLFIFLGYMQHLIFFFTLNGGFGTLTRSTPTEPPRTLGGEL